MSNQTPTITRGLNKDIAYNINNQDNGRVKFSNIREKKRLYEQDMYNDVSKIKNDLSRDMLSNITENTKLSKLYFSKENIKIIQNSLRYYVWINTDKKHIIDNQDIKEIQLIMRSFFLQYSPNLDTHITKQIAYLNDLVINYSVPRIITELKMYNKYISDIKRLPVPLERPVNMSSAGTKTNRSVTSIF